MFESLVSSTGLTQCHLTSTKKNTSSILLIDGIFELILLQNSQRNFLQRLRKYDFLLPSSSEGSGWQFVLFY
jgi:hypothetical protein